MNKCALPPKTQQDVSDRLSRVEGQLKGVRKMLGEDQDIEKVFQQLLAARNALMKVFHVAISQGIQEDFDRHKLNNESLSRYLSYMEKNR